MDIKSFNLQSFIYLIVIERVLVPGDVDFRSKLCPTKFQCPDWNREMNMCHLRGWCSTLFYQFASVYGNQWKIRAWMATIGRCPMGRFVVEGSEDFFSFECDAVSQGWYSSPEWAKKNERTDEPARFSAGLWNPWEVSNLAGNSL